MSEVKRQYYFCPDAKQVVGPFSLQQMHDLVQRGRVTDSVQVFLSGLDIWKPMLDYPELRAIYDEISRKEALEKEAEAARRAEQRARLYREKASMSAFSYGMPAAVIVSAPASEPEPPSFDALGLPVPEVVLQSARPLSLAGMLTLTFALETAIVLIAWWVISHDMDRINARKEAAKHSSAQVVPAPAPATDDPALASSAPAAGSTGFLMAAPPSAPPPEMAPAIIHPPTPLPSPVTPGPALPPPTPTSSPQENKAKEKIRDLLKPVP